MRILRGTLQFVLTLLTLAILAVAIVTLNAYRALPRTDGTLTLPQGVLGAPVSIVRDERGIPTITAANEDDVYVALGYVHAQDRLFQMELMRRSGQGRLSEILGSAGVGIDRFVRTLGLYKRAEADLAGFDPAVQHIAQKYADGVNAWLTTRDRPLPLEFQILWFTPEPWKPADSIAWQKLMGLQLSGNYDEELLRATLDAKLGPDRAGALFAAPREGDPTTVEATSSLPTKAEATPFTDIAALEPDRLLRTVLDTIAPTLASNAWAVAGSRTQSGKPLLANDPHLGFQLPSLWYLAILKWPEMTLTGATVPGVPLHILGHNRNVAWGITTTHGDTQDLFVEHVVADGKAYETPDGPKEFSSHTETIDVRFGKPLTVTVRETRHGPVLSDVLAERRIPAALRENGQVLSLSATLLQPDDRTAEALYRMARAPDAAAFKEATRLFHAPEQNLTYADADHIGFIAAGRLPLRKRGDGTVPAPGWSGDYDWTGWAPFEQLPQVLDPPSGLIVNGNNRVTAATDPLVAAHWPEAYRARRILSVLGSTLTPLTVTDMAALQFDTTSLSAREMLPLLLPHVTARDAAEQDLLKSMADWDGNMARERAEPLVFAAWADALKHALLADELGALYDSIYGQRIDVLRAALEQQDGPSWCDNVDTPAVETCPQDIQAAWNSAIDQLKTRVGADPAAWRWGEVHRGAFAHQVLDRIPGLRRVASRHPATPGGEDTINRGSYESPASAQAYAHVHGPAFRGAYDLSDLAGSRFTLAGGQSGHPASRQYDDLLRGWRDLATFTMAPAESHTPGSQTLVLTPKP